MKIVNIPIEMISCTTSDGMIKPIRFRYSTDDGNIVVKIDKVIQTEKNNWGGNANYRFLCCSNDNSKEKFFEVSYNTAMTKWLLFKV